MTFRQAYTELEGQFTTVVGATVSGNAVATNTLAAAASEVGEAEIADGAVTNGKLGVAAVSGAAIGSASVFMPHIANATVSGLHLVAQGIGADRILNAAITATQLANNACSGLRVSPEYGPHGVGSPTAFGQLIQGGNGTTSGASGLWVVFGRAFLAAPTVVHTSSRVAAIAVSHPAGSITAGSFFAISEGASRAFDWIAIGSGR